VVIRNSVVYIISVIIYNLYIYTVLFVKKIFAGTKKYLPVGLLTLAK